MSVHHATAFRRSARLPADPSTEADTPIIVDGLLVLDFGPRLARWRRTVRELLASNGPMPFAAVFRETAINQPALQFILTGPEFTTTPEGFDLAERGER